MSMSHPVDLGAGISFVREVIVSYGAKKPAPELLSSAAAVDFVRTIIPLGADREHFVVIALDARHRPLGWRVTSIGTLTSAIIHPREIFRPLLLLGAAAGIVAHNHPSGDETPSTDDDRVTRRLIAVGNLLGVQLLDHVVLGDDAAYSYRSLQPHLFIVGSPDDDIDPAS